jgi:hypothetical protein
MAMLGAAALAMWWDMAPDMRAEFEHWHTHEHFPERLALPGFMRASRWADAKGGDGFFVLYELSDHDVLASPEYLARLNAPTPWSRKLMPHHANMVRSQCVVLASAGAVAGGYALTVRFSAGPDNDVRRDALMQWLPQLAAAPGIAGAHVLRSDAPKIGRTVEQQIRGNADREADWMFVACGYSQAAIEGIEHPALDAGMRGSYRLSLCMVPGDLKEKT